MPLLRRKYNDGHQRAIWIIPRKSRGMCHASKIALMRKEEAKKDDEMKKKRNGDNHGADWIKCVTLRE